MVGDGGTHASLPHFLRAPSLRVGLRVVPAAGGLCPLARRKRAGSDLLCYRLRGLRPPTTSMLTAAGLRQQSALQRRGVVNRCWCDGGGGYPPSSGGGFTAVQRLPATAPTFVLGSGRGTFRVLSGGWSLRAWTRVRGVPTFSLLERALSYWNIRGLRPAFARQKEVRGFRYVVTGNA